MENLQITRFCEKVRSLAESRELTKLVLGKPRDPRPGLKNLVVTLAEIKTGLMMKLVYRYKTKDLTKNMSLIEAMPAIRKSLEEEFFNADLFSAAETVQLTATGRGKVKMTVKKTGATGSVSGPSLSHDHIKERIIPKEGNIYLRELGILNSEFEVRREMTDKYVQINRYIELLEPFLETLKLPDTLHVADMGAGKGYLTFALYDFLTRKMGKTPVMAGVEAREDLVGLCNGIAVKAGFSGLKFVQGTISGIELSAVDILIALHACDTATDDAIFRGIASHASLIVCAPCCHKQVRKDMKVPEDLAGVLKHGILLERQAEILTDGLRAMIMESQGYKTKIFEFVSTEHTPKNLLIVGKRGKVSAAEKERILENVIGIKQQFGIGRLYLEDLLEKDLKI